MHRIPCVATGFGGPFHSPLAHHFAYPLAAGVAVVDNVLTPEALKVRRPQCGYEHTHSTHVYARGRSHHHPRPAQAVRQLVTEATVWNQGHWTPFTGSDSEVSLHH